MSGTTTGERRREACRSLRAEFPRSAHAEWDVEARDRDAIAVLEEQERARPRAGAVANFGIFATPSAASEPVAG